MRKPPTTPRERNPRGQGERLRADIVAAAADILEEAGSAEAVTLRAVARRAGISAPSIYRHFPDPQAILLAITQDAFNELGMEMKAAYDTHPGDATTRLNAVCESYGEFAEDHASRYRVMFGGLWTAAPDETGSVSVSDLTALGEQALRVLSDSLADCVSAGASTSNNPQRDAVALWLGLHGLAHQRGIIPNFPWPQDIQARMVHLLAGLQPAH